MDEKYYHTKESVEEYIRLSKGVNGNALIQQLQQFLPSQSKMLEIGSGPGSDWKILNSSYHVIGSDISKEFLDHLTKNIPHGQFVELDAVTLKTRTSFDGIYSNKVLHHLTDQQLTDSIKRQFEILKTGGIVCHSFWDGEGSEVFNGLFVNYHSQSDLKKLYNNYFDILLLEYYQEFEPNDSILVIGKKKKLEKRK